MKKHEITAYTLEEGDALYCIKDGKINKIVVRQKNLGRADLSDDLSEDERYRINSAWIDPLIDGLYVKPGEKVRESDNGRLILWQPVLVKEFNNGTNQPRSQNLSVGYEEVETDIAISAELLRHALIARHMTQLSELFEEI